MKFSLPNRRTGAVLGAAAIIAVATGGGAVAGTMITGAQIKNGTVETVDLAPESVNSSRVENQTLRMWDFSEGVQDRINAGGPRGPQGPQGETGPAGPAGTAKYVGANWSQVDRNVTGNAFSQLRSGPVSGNFGVTVEPPLGMGSLGIHTGSGADKVAFGNQVDFVGQKVSDLDTIKFSVFTTGENRTIATNNLPSVAMEVDPNVVEGVNYSTLVFVPTDAAANQWTEIDASSAKQWYFTGGTGTTTGCNQTTYCTLAEVHEKAPDATIHTVQITKGRDYAFTGAVDALVLGTTPYDFEPLGVSSN